MKRWLNALALAAVLALPAYSPACPNCKEAITSAGDEDDADPFREMKAYNYSIYFMLAVPYGLAGTFGFAGYRMYRSARRCGPPAA